MKKIHKECIDKRFVKINLYATFIGLILIVIGCIANHPLLSFGLAFSGGSLIGASFFFILNELRNSFW